MKKHFPNTDEIIVWPLEDWRVYKKKFVGDQLMAEIMPMWYGYLLENWYEKVINEFKESIISLIKSIKYQEIMSRRMKWKKISAQEMEILTSLSIKWEIYKSFLSTLFHLENIARETRWESDLTFKEFLKTEIDYKKWKKIDKINRRTFEQLISKHKKLLFRIKRKLIYLLKLIKVKSEDKIKISQNPQLSCLAPEWKISKSIEDIENIFSQICLIFHTKKATLKDREAQKIDNQKSVRI